MNAGRHIVVTGGGSGIGLAVARRFAVDGDRVTLMGRNRERLERAAGNIANARAIVCDVIDESVVSRAFAAAGPAHILVNNAGVVSTAPFHKTPAAAWRAMLDVNLMGAVHASAAALASMRELDYGRIINVASTAGLKGYAYASAYAASKHALIGLTRSLALELARTAITVNAVCPGYTDTDIVKSSVENIVAKTGRSATEARASLTSANPQGRLIAPEEVADVVVWLASAGAASITGQAIAVAGGEVM